MVAVAQPLVNRQQKGEPPINFNAVGHKCQEDIGTRGKSFFISGYGIIV
jgi:hypothetical protein